ANDYYTGYINLATQLGIIGGYGDGRFGPNDTVTTAQAALMLSRALGYFKGNEIAQATDWALASIAQATKINMFGNLNLPTNAELARDNVAEMVFNTISKAVPVQYNELLGVYYNENQGIIYSLEFNYLQTLGYKNFDLVYRSNDRDMYGRPATTWGVGRYNAGNSTTSSGTITKTDNLTNEGGLLPSLVRLQEKDEIITVPNAPTYVYTDKTKEKDVYKNLGKSVCTAYANKNNDPGYEWTAFINGKEVETAADSYGKALIPGANSSDIYRFTAKGTQTEIYIDDDEQTVDVIEINY
ncbi:S-layer homology domain-containing protein, partial [Colidextribacter sp. OB.20]|uniref:S-layer homology domain-containing protein n=1 Tax=Colidextribacter sp. OB.20 TaxID=2304568 RepID=UPI00136FF193